MVGWLMNADEFTDPLFKGCTRPAMVLGVPLVPFMVACGSVLILASYTTVLVNVLLIPVVLVMNAIARTDDQQFRLIGLKLYCRVVRFNGNARFWKASSYAPLRGRR